jgi:hypothetical protein
MNFPPGVTPSKVFPTYWYFAYERQEIFLRRLSGTSPPWTQDPILQQYRFTCPYRASDRVSQYLIQRVQYTGDQSPEEVFFRTLLFDFFKKPETWDALSRSEAATRVPGKGAVERAWLTHVDDLLGNLKRSQPIYSAAYVMPAAETGAGKSKHRTHLELLLRMMAQAVPAQLQEAKTLEQAFRVLRAWPSLGDFLALQYTTDLNYSGAFDWPEDFVVPGPGARSGIRKCFESLGGHSESDIIRYMRDSQEYWFRYYGLPFRTLWGWPLQLIDIQNLFCETNKYARVAHPEVLGTDDRDRIKQNYRMDPRPQVLWFPPKWGINERIYPKGKA